MKKENPLKAHCDCYFGMKKKICRHLVGVAIQLGYLKPPAPAKYLPLGQKRKKGRPAKAKPALIIQ